jgi:xeroderma pigmentosum group C-complementing protein
MDAYWASTAAAEEREKQKRIDKALKRWGKLINALRVRERLRATYGDKEGVSCPFLHDEIYQHRL